MKFRRLLLPLLFVSFASFAQWQNLNPGGGGQIQGITADPNTPGRMFLNSDVEGNYRSDDYGQSWHYTGKELIHHMAFFTAVEPGNSNRVYCGGLYGLHVSDNGGLNWSVVNGPMKGFGTAAMVIDPTNVNNLYVGNSWYIKNAQMTQQKTPGEPTTGDRVVWVSKDRGATWQTVTYEPTDGYKQCYTISLDPTNASRVYLGAHSGLYRSTNGGLAWAKISSPAGQGSCRGFDISPDGQFAYAVFHSDETDLPAQTNVYVAAVNNASAAWTWTLIASPTVPNGLYYATGVQTYYWKPMVDPRSTATQHKVIIGCMASNANTSQGLYEFTGTVSGSSVSGNWQMVFGSTNAFTYDRGWNAISPQVRQYAYTPLSWNTRKVMLASQQSLYYGDPTLPNSDPTKYQVLSTRQVGTFGPYTTYATRGFQSTVNFDGTGLGNYVVQGMADNRILESWDGGISWTQDSRPGGGQNGDYVDIIPANNGQPPLVLTACGGGFGGTNDLADASHWGKKLSSPASPSDSWVSLETGTSGLPNANSRTYGSSYDPFDPKHVILATQNGLYETTDIYARYNGTGGTFQQIGGTVIYKGGSVWFSPVTPNVIYAINGTQGFIKGVKSGGSWTFTTLAADANSGYYWHHNGRDLLAYRNDGQQVFLSINGGASFTAVFDQAQATALHGEPWFGTWTNGQAMQLTFSGLAGTANELYTGSQVEDGKHGYAMYRGVINYATGAVTWSDWSGTYGTDGYMEIARLWDAKIVKDGAKSYYYAATRGAGLWRREATSQSSEKRLLDFAFNGLAPAVVGTVNETAKTVALTVPFGTNRTTLIPTLSVSPDATVSPASGVGQNFTTPVTYTVTAQDGSQQAYVVTVTVAANTERRLTGFAFNALSPAAVGTIDEAAKTVTVAVPVSTNLSALVPTVTVSTNATVSPASGVARNFSAPVTYTVTSESGVSQAYVVTVLPRMTLETIEKPGMNCSGNNVAVASWETSDCFVNTTLTMSGTATLSNTQLPAGGVASSRGYCAVLAGSTTRDFSIGGLSTTAYASPGLSFVCAKSSIATLDLTVEWSTNGTTWTAMPLTASLANFLGMGNGTSNTWVSVTTGALPVVANLTVRFRKTSAASSQTVRLDDFSLVETTGTNRLEAEASAERKAGQIAVFPNPSAGLVRVRLPEEGNATLILSDATGRVTLNTKGVFKEKTLDLRALPGGLYLLRVETDEWVAIEKIVLN